MNPAVEIVPLPPGFADWEGLLALILRAFAPMTGVIDPPSSALALTAEKLARKAETETVFLARASGKLVGCLFADRRSDCLYLGKLAVEPGFQGKGIGRRLMAMAETFAQESGLLLLELQTRVELSGNQQTFARLGFGETGRTAHPGFARPTTVTMRKSLA